MKQPNITFCLNCHFESLVYFYMEQAISFETYVLVTSVLSFSAYLLK